MEHVIYDSFVDLTDFSIVDLDLMTLAFNRHEMVPARTNSNTSRIPWLELVLMLSIPYLDLLNISNQATPDLILYIS